MRRHKLVPEPITPERDKKTQSTTSNSIQKNEGNIYKTWWVLRTQSNDPVDKHQRIEQARRRVSEALLKYQACQQQRNKI